ncbi:Serpin (serine protease inhibitor) [Popillia japonica]|uniref:Serpin (Serine protease inhibitor) n=1 Tax=Popillia japonica TaxID=7064 RepID=A0AAW1MZU2_POPJA
MKQLINIFISAAVMLTIYAENPSDSVSTALNQFALKFLAETSHQAGDNLNLAISPFTIWNVMAMITEGAQHHTADELERVLGIPSDLTELRDEFRKLQQTLNKRIMRNSKSVSLEYLNAIFTRTENKLKPEYQQLIQRLYNVDVTSLNFNDARFATKFINAKLSNVTRGRINSIVKEDDLTDAQIFITSALFFKGLWDLKFNRSDTKDEPFYDEQHRVLRSVPMMYNKGLFPLTMILNEKAYAIELPYEERKMSMIIVLPISITLQDTLDMLAQHAFTDILDNLAKSQAIFGNDPVKIYIPRFKIASDLNLNYVLYQLGIRDAFLAHKADLRRISDVPMFVSRVIHKAEIDVDEDGTVASSISAADIENKLPAAKIKANRPFAYFVYDKETNSIVFMGKYSIPKYNSSKPSGFSAVRNSRHYPILSSKIYIATYIYTIMPS